MVLRRMQRDSVSDISRINNRYLSSDEQAEKLRSLQARVKSTTDSHIRSQLRATHREESLRSALEADDIPRILHWLGVMSEFGDKDEVAKVRGYVADIIEAAGRGMKSPALAKGMKWRETSKDIAASIDILAGPRIMSFLQKNIRAPGKKAVKAHRSKERSRLYVPGGGDCAGVDRRNMEQAAAMCVKPEHITCCGV